MAKNRTSRRKIFSVHKSHAGMHDERLAKASQANLLRGMEGQLVLLQDVLDQMDLDAEDANDVAFAMHRHHELADELRSRLKIPHPVRAREPWTGKEGGV